MKIEVANIHTSYGIVLTDPLQHMEKVLQQLELTKLRPKQKKILKYLGAHQDVFGLLPTGYGKSVCYIVPHLLTNKNVIVISPLIALMQDQNDTLRSLGITTVCFNSSNPTLYGNILGKSQLQQIMEGTLKGILYFSPEKFIQSESLVTRLVKKDNLALIAVDEAHCVATWSDFRNSYRQLGCIRKWLSCAKGIKVPILALSASVPPSMLAAIASELKLVNPRLVKASFWKNNLSLTFLRKTNLHNDLQLITEEIQTHTSHIKGKTLIYCKTQAETQKLAEGLQVLGISAVYYHGGLEPSRRREIQTRYKMNQNGVMVATIAFGMGIDIPDIHLLVHYGVSRDIESYYQEIGRAGRDKQAATCLSFYSPADFSLNRRFANQIESASHRQRQIDACVNLEKLIVNNTCRMQQLVTYFGESADRTCGRCDICLHEKDTSIEESHTKPLQIPPKTCSLEILSALVHLGYGCGLRTLASILTGGKGKRVNPKMRGLAEYGRLSRYTQKIVGEWIQQLHFAGYLREHSSGRDGVNFLKISAEGSKLLVTLQTQIQKSLQVLIKTLRPRLIRWKRYNCNNCNNYNNRNTVSVKTKSCQGFQVSLELLKDWRYRKARERSIPPYCILSNNTLKILVENRPKDRHSLLQVKGIGAHKLEEYGDELLELLGDSSKRSSKVNVADG